MISNCSRQECKNIYEGMCTRIWATDLPYTWDFPLWAQTKYKHSILIFPSLPLSWLMFFLNRG